MFFKELTEIKNWRIVAEIVADKLKNNYPEIFQRKTNHSLIYLPIDVLELIRPQLAEMFLPLNINLKSAAVFVMYNNNDANLHADNFPENYRINIPIINCEGSKTQYFEVSESIYYRNSFYEIKLPSSTSQIKFLNEFELQCPTIISVNDFHKVLLGKNVPRISLTLSFYEDISFLLS